MRVLALGLSAPPLGAQVVHVEPARAPGVAMPDGPVLSEAALARSGFPRAPGSGRSAIVVLPALFADSPEPWVDQGTLQAHLFDGPSARGTFEDFYREVSGGRLDIQGTVLDWVRTDVTLMEAADVVNGHGWIGSRIDDYVIQALEEADATVDFGRFDNDGPDRVPNSGDDDGRIDALSVMFLEVSGSCGGPGVWPHLGFIQDVDGSGPWPSNDRTPGGDPIVVGSYVIESVATCGGDELAGVATLAHEYGHFLGLPDLYDRVEGQEPWERYWNVGCYGLMAAGSWGCGTLASFDDRRDFGPVGFSAWSMERLGWLMLDNIGEVRETGFVLEPTRAGGRAIRVLLPDRQQLLIEYRPRTGFDEALPAGGVLVYHVDYGYEERNPPPGLPPATEVHLIEADGDHALRKTAAAGGNLGVAGDVFGVDGRTGPYSAVEGTARLLDHEGGSFPVTIHSVRVDGDVARLVLTTHRVPEVTELVARPSARALEETELATFRIVGGAPPYAAVNRDVDAHMRVDVSGTVGRLIGVPLGVGAVEIDVTIRDALGTETSFALDLEVDDAPLSLGDALDALFDALDGTATDRSRYLDATGNRNGQTDVGDLRAWLQRAGASGAARG